MQNMSSKHYKRHPVLMSVTVIYTPGSVFIGSWSLENSSLDWTTSQMRSEKDNKWLDMQGNICKEPLDGTSTT